MPGDSADILSVLSDSPTDAVLERFRGTHVTSHSSEVRPGTVFVAIRGTKLDGHDYLNVAGERGAACAILERSVPDLVLPHHVVPDTRLALSRLSARAHGSPSQQLFTVAVTGTNGKTTTHWIVAHLLDALGQRTMRIGTLGVALPDGTLVEEGLTTPDAAELHRILAFARDSNCTAAVMEASSHALAQSRLDDVSLNVAVFTNLTRDHLDYHGTFENYAAAKGRLFPLLARSHKEKRRAVINIDDSFGRQYAEFCRTQNIPCITYGREGDAGFVLLETVFAGSGSIVRFERNGMLREVRSPYIGEHNSENLLGALGACEALGLDMNDLLRAVPKLPQVPGRLEAAGDAELPIFVDYAHTPDALERVLIALRPLAKRRLVVVFGCGGDRDRGKRPMMGGVAARLADEVIVTSDNPRTENPEVIIDEILAGVPSRAQREVDRRRAIELAVQQAQAGDIILIAGKGHEPYQLIGNERLRFSDTEEAGLALMRRRKQEGACSTSFG